MMYDIEYQNTSLNHISYRVKFIVRGWAFAILEIDKSQTRIRISSGNYADTFDGIY
jgi:hypothetical protein